MKLITWNTGQRVKTHPAQVEALLSEDPDLLCLQEVSRRTAAAFASRLGPHATNSLDRVHADAPRRRSLGVLTWSRWPIQTLEAIWGPWPEKILLVRVKHDSGAFVVANVHVPPGSSNGVIKVETLEAVYRAVRTAGGVPVILAGDFNGPREELGDGTVIT